VRGLLNFAIGSFRNLKTAVFDKQRGRSAITELPDCKIARLPNY
jgi:hypothetical protein